MVILGKGKAMPRALIVIDMQADFCPGGALAVADGDGIVGPINALMADHDAVVLTQDWHPANHASFAPSGMSTASRRTAPWRTAC